MAGAERGRAGRRRGRAVMPHQTTDGAWPSTRQVTGSPGECEPGCDLVWSCWWAAEPEKWRYLQGGDYETRPLDSRLPSPGPWHFLAPPCPGAAGEKREEEGDAVLACAHLPRWREGAGPALRALPFSQQHLLSSSCAPGTDQGAGADPGLRQNPCPRVDVLHLVRGRVAPE